MIRFTPDPHRTATLSTAELRASFLLESLFAPGELTLHFSDLDRAIVGSAMPTAGELRLEATPELRAGFFCERRELGVLNIGGPGKVTVDGVEHALGHRDGLYAGRGSREIVFAGAAPENPARFYLLSFPAHASHPTVAIRHEEAEKVRLGSPENANVRTLTKLIHPAGARSCQLVMGFTSMEPGSVWNTMPPHTHERRMEVYLYFDLPPGGRVFHLMGRPEETRHLVVGEGQAVLSPSWSIHSGVGTGAYSFCWGMGGENQAFDDMDLLKLEQLR